MNKKIFFFLIPLVILIVSFMFFISPRNEVVLTTGSVSTPTGLYLGSGSIFKNNPHEGWTIKSYTQEIDSDDDGYPDLISNFTYIDENTIEIYINDTKNRKGNDKWVSAVCNITGVDTILKSEYNPSTEVWTNTGELNHDLLLNYGLPSDWCNESGGYGFILFSAGTDDRQYRLHLPNGEKELSIKAGSGTETLTFVYQNISKVEYIHDDYSLNATLYMNINGNWNNTINDIFVFDFEDKDKFGANVTGFEDNQLFKYVIESSKPIQSYKDLEFMLNDGKEKITFYDICYRLNNLSWTDETQTDTIGEEYFNSSCIFTYINDYTLEIVFNGYNDNGLIFIDPEIELNTINNGIYNNTLTESFFSYLNISNANIKLYFPLDVDTSSTVYDLSPNQVDCSITHWGSPEGAYSEGKFGSGYRFPDGGDTLWSCGQDKFNWNSTNELTASFWAKPYDDFRSTYEPIFYRDLFLRPLIIYNFGGSKDVRAGVRTTVNTFYATTNGDNFPHGVWTYVTVTYKDNVLTVWINGENTTDTVTTGTLSVPNGYNVAFGSNAPSSSVFYNGSLDEFMLLDVALNESQIKQIYNNTYQRFYDTGTINLNQTITAGNNSVNLSIEHFNQNNTNLSISVYDGTSWSPRFNMSNATEQNFTIDDTATVLNISILFHSANRFWSPILNQTVKIEIWNNTDIGGGEPPGDTCTCPGIGSDHTFDLSDSCVVSTCNANIIDFTGTGNAVSCTGAWNVTEIDLNLGLWLINPSASCIITTRD